LGEYSKHLIPMFGLYMVSSEDSTLEILFANWTYIQDRHNTPWGV